LEQHEWEVTLLRLRNGTNHLPFLPKEDWLARLQLLPRPSQEEKVDNPMTKIEVYETLQKGLEDGLIEVAAEQAPLIRYRRPDGYDMCPLTACLWLKTGRFIWMEWWPEAASELGIDMLTARSIVYMADNVFP
jgi:hypothetical protein